jgi:ribonuclease HI
MNNSKSCVTIWTDGSCLKNPGPGGWAFIIEFNDLEYEVSCDSCGITTNNEMELKAIIRSLEFIYSEDLIKSIDRIIVRSDSRYSVRGINEWADRWIKQDKITPDTRPNWKLWKRLHQLKTTITKSIPLEFKWVKAHGTNEMNNRVDRLARQRAEELKARWC